MLIVKGVKRSTGNYQGFDYDNYVLQCLQTDPDSQNVKGMTVETVKCKVAWFKQIFAGILDEPSQFELLFDQAIVPSYDKSGKVTKIDIVEVGKGVY